jgi:hypothetical protein
MVVKVVWLVLLCEALTAIAATTQVVNVATRQELVAAMNGSAQHVHITRHLDLTDLTKARLQQPAGSPLDPLFTPGAGLHSLTVCCFCCCAYECRDMLQCLMSDMSLSWCAWWSLHQA